MSDKRFTSDVENLTDEQKSQLVSLAKNDTRNPRTELRW